MNMRSESPLSPAFALFPTLLYLFFCFSSPAVALVSWRHIKPSISSNSMREKLVGDRSLEKCTRFDEGLEDPMLDDIGNEPLLSALL